MLVLVHNAAANARALERLGTVGGRREVIREEMDRGVDEEGEGEEGIPNPSAGWF